MLAKLFALVLGAFFFTLSGGQYNLWFATLVWPVCFLYFERRVQKKWELGILALVLGIITFFKFDGGFGYTSLFTFLLTVVIGLLYILPFLADRLYRGRRLLIFPAAMTLLDIFFSNAITGENSLVFACSLAEHPILIQTVSIYGTFGLDFLIFLFASALEQVTTLPQWVAAWRNKEPFPVKKSMILSVVCLLVIPGWILAYGTIALNAPAVPSDTVQVAGVICEYEGIMGTEEPATLSDCLTDFTKQATNAANAGAKLICWNEEAYNLMQEDVEPFLSEAKRLAWELNVTLIPALMVIPEGDEKMENVLYVVSPEGTVQCYRKYNLIPIVESFDFIAGDGVLPAIEIGDGVFSTAICNDDTNPGYIASLSQKVDALILPVWDWDAVAEMHKRCSMLRCVENGIYYFRVAYGGTSFICDPTGHLLFTSDTKDSGYGTFFTASLPIGHQPTLHGSIGMYVEWVLILLFILLLTLTKLRERRSNSVSNHNSNTPSEVTQ